MGTLFTKMKVVNFVLLLIAAALCIQAVTHEAETGDTVDLGSVVGESAGVGRRGGLISSGSFVLMSPGANRAGNDEEELGASNVVIKSDKTRNTRSALGIVG